jgi:hypothetical protein
MSVNRNVSVASSATPFLASLMTRAISPPSSMCPDGRIIRSLPFAPGVTEYPRVAGAPARGPVSTIS